MITGSMRLDNDFRHRHWTLTGRNFDLSQLVGECFSSSSRCAWASSPWRKSVN